MKCLWRDMYNSSSKHAYAVKWVSERERIGLIHEQLLLLILSEYADVAASFASEKVFLCVQL